MPQPKNKKQLIEVKPIEVTINFVGYNYKQATVFSGATMLMSNENQQWDIREQQFPPEFNPKTSPKPYEVTYHCQFKEHISQQYIAQPNTIVLLEAQPIVKVRGQIFGERIPRESDSSFERLTMKPPPLLNEQIEYVAPALASAQLVILNIPVDILSTHLSNRRWETYCIQLTEVSFEMFHENIQTSPKEHFYNRPDSIVLIEKTQEKIPRANLEEICNFLLNIPYHNWMNESFSKQFTSDKEGYIQLTQAALKAQSSPITLPKIKLQDLQHTIDWLTNQIKLDLKQAYQAHHPELKEKPVEITFQNHTPSRLCLSICRQVAQAQVTQLLQKVQQDDGYGESVESSPESSPSASPSRSQNAIDITTGTSASSAATVGSGFFNTLRNSWHSASRTSTQKSPRTPSPNPEPISDSTPQAQPEIAVPNFEAVRKNFKQFADALFKQYKSKTLGSDDKQTLLSNFLNRSQKATNYEQLSRVVEGFFYTISQHRRFDVKHLTSTGKLAIQCLAKPEFTALKIWLNSSLSTATMPRTAEQDILDGDLCQFALRRVQDANANARNTIFHHNHWKSAYAELAKEADPNFTVSDSVDMNRVYNCALYQPRKS